ncbi:putative transcription factor, MBF1 like protein [Frateuria aurantia DSM 6220]|uniref:Putative transcription factor, MBF1 like protein n=1 Tax=Frateuria aurantia (strain ATCC 33424 / DSM 6220 / KCTC 2777 / LMG 1558 / NBRC 3245 / NCIMB 13370) TaxID=767434 RepID=H8L0T3_FRAAD|nr:putative transcription factor, MBF1 like protein [Frateuria aurantia DSM 6220]
MYRPIESATQLGKIIRDQRKGHGLRQEDLASMIGVSHVSLAHIEQGRPSAKLGNLLELMSQLGLRLVIDVPAEERVLAAEP